MSRTMLTAAIVVAGGVPLPNPVGAGSQRAIVNMRRSASTCPSLATSPSLRSRRTNHTYPRPNLSRFLDAEHIETSISYRLKPAHFPVAICVDSTFRRNGRIRSREDSAPRVEDLDL
jgi:hypothetical protein